MPLCASWSFGSLQPGPGLQCSQQSYVRTALTAIAAGPHRNLQIAPDPSPGSDGRPNIGSAGGDGIVVALAFRGSTIRNCYIAYAGATTEMQPAAAPALKADLVWHALADYLLTCAQIGPLPLRRTPGGSSVA